jgi:iron complex outermembrane recepter protein
MKASNHKRHTSLGAVGALSLMSILVAQSLYAQQAPAKVEKIEVTGSNIKRVDAEGTVPITIISSEEIRRSGATTIQELLNDLPISSGSALTDLTGGNGFSTGSASVALRGLGSAATLTLINGRRISPAAFNDPNVGSTVITNLNAIPTSAIERIEILRDGASAIYGSDAIAGVVNIILRKDYKGAIATVTASQSPRNEFLVTSASAAFGFGDIAKDRYNIFGSYERFDRKPVLIKSEDNVDSLWQNPLYGRLSVLSTLSAPPNYYREGVRGSGVFGTFQAAPASCPPQSLIGGLCRYNQWNDLEQSGRTERDTFCAARLNSPPT